MAMKKGLALAFLTVLVATAAGADDARDVGFLADVMNRRLETQPQGVEVGWLNPETGNSGNVIILGTDFRNPPEPCRTYRRTTDRPDGTTTVVEGFGCRVGEGLWQRTETQSFVLGGPADPSTPVARSEPEPAEPPPVIPPPGRKPDPNVFFASVPTPSDYR